MLLRTKKNRRKLDVKAATREHAPRVFRLVALGCVVIAVGFVAQLGWAWAQVSPQFALKAVDVHGTARAADAELLRMAGLTDSPNLFQLDAAAVERAIAAHPWVKTVRATRRFPSRLSIEVVEHRPAAVVSLGDLYLVNDEGQPFKRLQPQDDLDLPLVTGLDREAFSVRPQEARERVLAALEVLKVWKPQPAEIRTSAQGLTILQPDGLEVRVGEGDLAAKMEKLAQVRKELSARRLSAEVIRLDNRTRPDWVTVQVAASPKTDAPYAPRTNSSN